MRIFVLGILVNIIIEWFIWRDFISTTGLLNTDLDRLIDPNDTYMDSVLRFAISIAECLVDSTYHNGDDASFYKYFELPHHDFESSAFNVTVWDRWEPLITRLLMRLVIIWVVCITLKRIHPIYLFFCIL